MTEQKKQELAKKLEDATKKHAEEQLKKLGCTPTTITLVVVVIACIFAYLMGGCTNTTIKNATIQRDLIITQPIESKAKAPKQAN